MSQNKPIQLNPNLTEFQKSVMFDKATESRFSGQYDNFYQDGEYACANCNSKLYSSSAKFDAGCGWPAFDKCYPDSVLQIPDDDGRRVEILCKNCNIHLGHIFTGEHLTVENTRHCVNSTSIKYVKKESEQPKTTSLIVGCGCFWGVQYWFDKLEGVISTSVGYSGGSIANPTYQQVCTGKTGHIEVLKIDYNPSILSYDNAVRHFFNIHNFEQANGQGADIGSQYLSVIQYQSESQKAIINQIIKELKTKGYKPATQLVPETQFWAAEDYHQGYYSKNQGSPYCHFYKKIV